MNPIVIIFFMCYLCIELCKPLLCFVQLLQQFPKLSREALSLLHQNGTLLANISPITLSSPLTLIPIHSYNHCVSHFRNHSIGNVQDVEGFQLLHTLQDFL